MYFLYFVFFFVRYAVSLCNVLPTIGQYSIDISFKYSFVLGCYRSPYSLQLGPRVLMSNLLEIKKLKIDFVYIL